VQRSVRSDPDGEAIGYRKRWAHILPNVFIVYTVSYLDRVNIGTALPSISADLHLTSTQAGFVGGVFFWGYLVSFLGGGWLANRFGAKRVTLTCLIAWGFFAIAGGLTTNFYELVATRVLLGLAEGPIWSSVSALLSQWFLKTERGRAFGIWNISIPIGALIAGPLSGLVLSYSSWHVMLIIEGLPAWIWALVWWRSIPDSPQSAAWLTKEERETLLDGLAAEQAEFDATMGPMDWKGMILHPGVWLLLVAKTFNNMVEYGFTLWLPTAIKDASSLPIGLVGLLSALPYLASAIGIAAVGFSSDRLGERRLHGAIPLMLLAALLYTSVHLGSQSFIVLMLFFTLTGFFLFMTLPLITVMYTAILPRKQAIAAIAFSGGIANLFGGFFGPMMVGWLKSITGDFSLAFSVLAVFGLIGGLLILAVRLPGSSAEPHGRKPLGQEALAQEAHAIAGD
jgi:sugar phosphate permease